MAIEYYFRGGIFSVLGGKTHYFNGGMEPIFGPQILP
jgi:hypothetical protein